MFCLKCGNKLQANDKFCDSCGTKVGKQELKTIQKSNNIEETPKLTPSDESSKNKIWLVIIPILVTVGIIMYTNNENQQHLTPTPVPNQQEVQKQFTSPTVNTRAVVNVICNNGDGGTGTIFTDDGSVLTNNHVVEKATICNVTLPDPSTGTPTSIYEAIPVIVPKLSKQYDIAMLSIDAAFIDSDGKTWGQYPTKFPTFSPPDNCANSYPQLGDSIKIYGYPVTSGGYNLTITEGIISSFADNGDILTSAKIDNGNSGGLAVDQNGCFIGIPTAVVSGNYQNLGVIIPKNIVLKFFDDVTK
jgi:S1-C subfamily serine protease